MPQRDNVRTRPNVLPTGETAAHFGASPRRVCQVVDTNEGATWMLEQLRELRDTHGFAVAAVVSDERGGLIDKLRAENIPFYVQDFGFARVADLLTLPFKIAKLAKHFRRERFDVVQTHLFNSMIIGRLAAWLADVPVRLAMIAGPLHLEAPTPRWIDRWTWWMDTAIIGSCRHTCDLYRAMGVPDERLALIYYGPDENKFELERATPASIREEFGWEPTTPVIGMVAYFYPPRAATRWAPAILHGRAIKGHDDLIRAVPTIVREFPEAKVLLVGSGWEESGEVYKRRMEELVDELGLSESITFTGFRGDVQNILRALDISVQPSLCENLGGTIEALLMECPVVATRVGGMVDSVRDGETGVLVDVCDPESLAAGILRLLRQPAYARTLAIAGRKFMLERFTLRRTAADLSRLYRELLDKPGRDRAGYRLSISAGRTLALVPVAGCLALRLVILDVLVLPAWERSKRLLHDSSRFSARVRAAAFAGDR